MGDIVPFPKKDNVIYYVFNINFDHYTMIFFEDQKKVSYAALKEVDGDFVTENLPDEKIKELFEETYPFFFLKVKKSSKEDENIHFALMSYFDFEGKKYAVYYNEQEEDDLIIFEIVNKNIKKIDNEFEVKRVQRYFDETFYVEWLD